jgi:hypothetical protein
MAVPSPDSEHISIDISDRLTAEEDDELRRLNYLWEMGLLSEGSQERLVELRLRDRRKKVRGPREFGDEWPDEDC